ncbi:MAG: glycosyl hydrolase, partial [Bacteroidia bacterium]|nr:glycosyl hydrolase [Bacteroidia bacterium]
ERVGIQPQERDGEDAYRFNWDSPLVVSRHASGRIYFAANKVFRSDDYGNSWDVISDDLSQQIDRNTLKVYDRVVSIDAVMKNGSTSLFGSIVAFSESPLNQDLLAAGTDDGLIHISENGGNTWQKVSNINGAPKMSYVNAVYLSKHDENVIYAAFNHHKYGDFKPYIFMSSDKGKTWTSISTNLPKGSVYSIEEDHVDRNLIFCGTEYGAFFSPNKGNRWKELSVGLPTIAVRDIAIQERENDLVLGTFGRGFFVLDDYSALRDVENSEISEKAIIYPIRESLSWEQSSPLGLPGKAFQGDNFYTAENLGPEAMITYYYDEDYKTLEEQRRELEKEKSKKTQTINYPSFDDYKAERNENAQKLVFTIKDANGTVVKKELRKPKKGIQRFKWNLRYTLPNPVDLSKSSFYNPWASKDEGTLIKPGIYTVEMELLKDGKLTQLVAPKQFSVKALKNTTMPAVNKAEKVAFQKQVAQLQAKLAVCQDIMGETRTKLKYMKVAIERSEQPYGKFLDKVLEIENTLKVYGTELYGDSVKRKLDINQSQNPATRIGNISYEQKYSTSAPTGTHKMSYAIAKREIDAIKKKIEVLFNEDVKQLETQLIKVKVPYTPGRGYKFEE